MRRSLSTLSSKCSTASFDDEKRWAERSDKILQLKQTLANHGLLLESESALDHLTSAIAYGRLCDVCVSGSDLREYRMRMTQHCGQCLMNLGYDLPAKEIKEFMEFVYAHWTD